MTHRVSVGCANSWFKIISTFFQSLFNPCIWVSFFTFSFLSNCAFPIYQPTPLVLHVTYNIAYMDDGYLMYHY